MLCGVGLAAPSSASAGSGGAFSSLPAAIKSVACVARCAGFDAAKPGSLLRVRGRSMGNVEKVVFLGGRGHADNVTVRVRRARRTSVDVSVPEKASSGRLRAVNTDGGRSRASRALVTVQRRANSGVLDVRVVGRRVYYGAARRARVDMLARSAMTVTVAVVRVGDGAVVAGWPVTLVPETITSITWDGTLAGAPQPPGRYEFRVLAGGPAGAGAIAAQAPAPLGTGAFDLVDHVFPVRGRHSYGTGIAAFGAGRDGHLHQGQDVFARCGTRLAAARSGVVKVASRERSAGNYVVIDGDGTDVDYVYMHLQARSPLSKGERVRTGQTIGKVGQTGVAVGCHLHFEMWPAGWQKGEAPVDPLAFLKLWDAYS